MRPRQLVMNRVFANRLFTCMQNEQLKSREGHATCNLQCCPNDAYTKCSGYGWPSQQSTPEVRSIKRLKAWPSQWGHRVQSTNPVVAVCPGKEMPVPLPSLAERANMSVLHCVTGRHRHRGLQAQACMPSGEMNDRKFPHDLTSFKWTTAVKRRI